MCICSCNETPYSFPQFGSLGQRSAQISLSHFVTRLSEPKIADHKRLSVEHHIGEFEVSMHHLVFAQNLEPIHHLLQKIDGLFFRQELSRLLIYVMFEVASVAILKDQIVVIGRLEKVIQMHDVRMVNVHHNAHLGLQKLF